MAHGVIPPVCVSSACRYVGSRIKMSSGAIWAHDHTLLVVTCRVIVSHVTTVEGPTRDPISGISSTLCQSMAVNSSKLPERWFPATDNSIKASPLEYSVKLCRCICQKIQ